MSERRSPQDIFDAAYKGLASQGFKQSKFSNDAGCAYRGEGGLKCAVGHLIADDSYNPGIEGLSARDDTVLAAAGLSSGYAEILDNMQCAHDGNDTFKVVTPDEMKSRLADVAAKHGLTVPEVSA